MAMINESTIDTSDVEVVHDSEDENIFDSEIEEMCGKGYVSVGGKVPPSGKAPRMDVQTTGSLESVSMKESVTGTRITSDAKMETEAESKRKEPPARAAKTTFARLGHTGGVRKTQPTYRLQMALRSKNKSKIISGASRSAGYSIEEYKSRLDGLTHRFEALEDDYLDLESSVNSICSRFHQAEEWRIKKSDAQHSANKKLEARVTSLERLINECYEDGKPEDERMIIPCSKFG